MEIQTLNPTLPRNRQRIETFLKRNALRFEDMDYYAAVTDDDGAIIAGGGLKGEIIKCVAVDDAHKGEAIANTLVSHLITHANQEGYSSIKLFTKPQNRRLFESLSFRLLAEAPEAVLMETGIGGLNTTINNLKRMHVEGNNVGIIVMNCNPFTLGHRYLIEQAAKQVEWLFVMVVREDCSLFAYTERKAMVEQGIAQIKNVRVVDGSEYTISRTTFPTYFLKRLDDAADTQMILDLDLFRRHIAPALGATWRFVGSEPSDALTARYNVLMKQRLEKVVEVPRLQIEGRAVNASEVRNALHDGCFNVAQRLVPLTSLPYLLAKLATRALQMELDTTPKPGLVDRHDSGAHTDMNYLLMCRSINALHPFFVRLALLGFRADTPTHQAICQIGLEAEHAMLEATHGVNTHRGALFAMGLAIVAASHMAYIYKGDIAGRAEELCHTIALLAHSFPYAEGTHGSNVRRSHNVRGALDMARMGYSELLSHWLPTYAAHRNSPFAPHITLLNIMSTLDDTNIIHRTNADTLQQVKAEAHTLYHNFSITALNEMNSQYVKQNISPGGSADMLALTIFTDSVYNCK